MTKILAVAALIVPLQTFAVEKFEPAYSSSALRITSDTLIDEEFEIRHLLESQVAKHELESAKIKADLRKRDLDRGRVLAKGPSLSPEQLSQMEYDYRESSSEIVRLQGVIDFNIAMANIYKVRIVKGANFSQDDMKTEVGYRIQAMKAKLSGLKATHESTSYGVALLKIRDQHGQKLLKRGSITESEAEKRTGAMKSGLQLEASLKAQIEIIQKSIENLEKTQHLPFSP